MPLRDRLRWRCSNWSCRQPLGPATLAHDPGMFFRLTVVIHAGQWHHVPDVAGRTRSSSRGISNSISLIIFIGHRGRIPRHIAQFLATGASNGSTLLTLGIVVMVIAVIAFVVFGTRCADHISIRAVRWG